MTQDPTGQGPVRQREGALPNARPKPLPPRADYGAKYDHLFTYVCHTQLRDSNKKLFQVNVGQGEIAIRRII